MINLIKVKEKQKEAAAAAAAAAQNTGSATTPTAPAPVKEQSASKLRVLRDMSELTLPPICTIEFPNGKDDLMNFEVIIKPDEGYYRDGTFTFKFQIPILYPHDAPKVKCKEKVYHPNIDFEGNVCLNILREDWKPVLNINAVIYGLVHLFTEPNHEDPLNQLAADDLRDDPQRFEGNVRNAMWGHNVHEMFYDRVLDL